MVPAGHLLNLQIKGNGQTTTSFPKFEISKLIRNSQLFHIRGLSVSPFVFHHVYSIDSDFKHIFPDLTHVKMFFNNSSDKRLCLDISNQQRRIFYFEVRHRKGEINVLFLWGANYHFDTAKFLS